MAKEKKNPDLDTLDKIRESGNIKQIETVISLLQKNPESEVAIAAAALLGDIKDKEAIPILLKAIQNPDNESIQRELIQVCWESGLDYSEHLPFFVDLFLNLDYIEALEAFTLIENIFSDFSPSEEIIPELAAKIKAVVIDLPEHKQNLAMEMLHVIQG